MNRMVALLLLVPLAVVLAADLPLSRRKCSYGDEQFCDRLKLAHKVNDGVKYMFEDEEGFTNVKESVSSATQEISEVMKAGNKTELRVLLGNALLLETTALSELEHKCNETKSERCETGLEHLSDAIGYLVDSAKEIAEANQLQAIKKAEETFRSSKDKDPKVAHKLGMEAVEALEDTEMKHE